MLKAGYQKSKRSSTLAAQGLLLEECDLFKLFFFCNLRLRKLKIKVANSRSVWNHYLHTV